MSPGAGEAIGGSNSAARGDCPVGMRRAVPILFTPVDQFKDRAVAQLASEGAA
jgi:hypothetical protein